MSNKEKEMIEAHGKKIAELKDYCDKLDNLDKLYFSRYLLNEFIISTEKKYEEYLKSLENSETPYYNIKVDENGNVSKVD